VTSINNADTLITLIRTLLKMIIIDGTISVMSVSALLIDVTTCTYLSDTYTSSRSSIRVRSLGSYAGITSVHVDDILHEHVSLSH